ncbi:hypothetical protein ACFYVR_24965 [Rhodococcus sp. NPDC003318]|uniref:hypothetical protein n=1 Tax=Rhodococcus sp. NPDC003318 TaxID=3364503 RepID=UPI0036777522
MGQGEGYRDYIKWDPATSEDLKTELGPFQIEFGVHRDSAALAAVEAAEISLEAATFARKLVRQQAVFSLAVQGLGVREIARQLSLSKSEVGRIMRQIRPDENGRPVRRSSLTPAPSVMQPARELIRRLWGHQ